MAFLAALPEIAGAAGEAGAAGAEAGAAGAEAGGAGAEAGSGDLFKGKPSPLSGDQGKQQNVGESRTFNFQAAAQAARNAFRPSAGGVD